MKKFLFGLIATVFITLSITPSAKAQSSYYNGKNVRLMFPRDIAASSTYTFPTFKYYAPVGWHDTIPVTINDLENYVLADSLKGTTLINLTVSSYVLPGAKLWLQLGNTAADTARTVYVKQGSYALDTITVTNKNIKRGAYLYNGTKFEYFPK